MDFILEKRIATGSADIIWPPVAKYSQILNDVQA
jgi:hypothetical protein